MQPATEPLGWRPALDGLRAVAVIVVMLRHFETGPWIPGGILGVDLFFVLSGFLITTLLLEEWQSNGTISLPGFYARRALRLLPALYLLLAAYLIVAVGLREFSFTGHQDTTHVLRSLGLAVLYCFNWIRALEVIPPNGTTHLWSLAVEEQFYLVWPCLLLLMLRLKLRPGHVLALSVFLILASASLPAWKNADDARWYYGTDFRLHELMVGAVAAQLFVAGVLSRSLVQQRRFQFLVAGAALFLVVSLFALTGRHPQPFIGYYLLVSIAAACIIIAAVHAKGGPVTRLLTSAPMVYIGKRSYALYLWHYPIGYWLRDLGTAEQVLVATLLSFLAAELSYRLVEKQAARLKARMTSHAHKEGRESGPVPSAA